MVNIQWDRNKCKEKQLNLAGGTKVWQNLTQTCMDLRTRQSYVQLTTLNYDGESNDC